MHSLGTPKGCHSLLPPVQTVQTGGTDGSSPAPKPPKGATLFCAGCPAIPTRGACWDTVLGDAPARLFVDYFPTCFYARRNKSLWLWISDCENQRCYLYFTRL